MVSHTSVTNVTSRQRDVSMRLTPANATATTNGHRNLPGYVKNGSVSDQSNPSSAHELHVQEDEPSKMVMDEKPAPLVEEERETVMWLDSCYKEPQDLLSEEFAL